MGHIPIVEKEDCETLWWIIYGLIGICGILLTGVKILYKQKESLSEEFMEFLISWRNVKNGD